ncbi:pilus assembly protein [Microbulbifer harenosus]|uniref:PilY1 beta-propeller domain-containing protein n=1 Tax=Microbulbifer harenosus TaxID=2576840 RepID=A0ABY2UJ26_9GAMM|nr:PilC/PilY family type IV pilus protein [Microbulbifer harenosus]TLM74826.1 hypothetical protein FDY93_16630 [Microbulbifer harenosus]
MTTGLKKMLLKRIKSKFLTGASAAIASVLFSHAVYSQELVLAQSPLFLAQPVKPLVMLNMSNDHQLYFKAYDDYTDLDEDGVADTTYKNTYDYYGYFDSKKCYSYESSRFVPKALAINHFCDEVDGEWSGNFLNWATMTRMDAVRKILYGGYRSTDEDESGITVLERAFLPQDAHAFAKYYNGTDIAKLTAHAFSSGTTNTAGITLCNTTDSATYNDETTVLSQNNTRAPKIMVVQGNYSLWASNERWQCRWGNGSNGNSATSSGINAHSNAPSSGTTYVARVEVCKAGLLEENCRSYPDGNSKPAGLLQKYGEKGEILFGLMTGSYGKNKSGGVLRKNIGDLSGEIFADTDGRFTGAAGIVSTLDKLRIYGYQYSGPSDDGVYNHARGDNCNWGRSTFTDGNCSNWGNPQSEIYLESLRYLAGKSKTAAFDSSDSSYISGLSSPDWVSPIGSSNYCAALNIIQFNASSSSYDDDFSGASDLNAIGSVDTWTNKIGAAEAIHGKDFFVGENGSVVNQLCTPKTVANLSDVAGTCPDAPRLGGTYDIAGLAYYARSSKIRTDYNVGNVTTYGVALAPAVPKVTIPVSADNKVTLLPACRNKDVGGNCAIVDFKVVSQSKDGTSGKLYVNWEDSEQGGDFDQDMWGVIDYSLSGIELTVTTNVIAESTVDEMGFGYVIAGTTNDGFHVHSGIEGFTDGGCNNCQVWDGATSKTFVVGSSSASTLEQPLYYAAKWGGFSDDENGNPPTDAEIAAATPKTYFYAIDPAELEKSLGKALEQVAASAGSASSVATNSTRLGTDTVIYQALFNSADWSGEIKALSLNSDGSVGSVKWKSDNSKFEAALTRDVFTHDGSTGKVFNWDQLSTAQQNTLIGDDTVVEGVKRLAWVRGEAVAGLRDREHLLGDIVNSSPVYAGTKKYNFHLLSDALGGLTYETYYNTYKKTRSEVLYVGANDGMLHAFDAANGTELFSYVPAGVYDKLKNLSAPDYGTSNNSHAYSVDGKLFVGDAYINGSWKNILVGTLGAGGKGFFVLDVTNPTSFDESNVLLDMTDPDLFGTTFNNLGNIISEPVVAPTKNGWKIFLGNGYNSTAGTANLFVVDLNNAASNTKVIAAGTAGANGLAGPALLSNGDGEVVTAYAGDLLGNMWKFDLGDTQTSKWGIAYQDGKGAGALDAPLFRALDADGNSQKITATPTLGLNAKMDNAVMVYFGTGSYLTSSDNGAGRVINSVYAIADQGAPVTGRDQLFQKTISTQANGLRDVSNNTDTSWWTTKKGWYLDLTFGGVVSGERITSKPLLIYDRLLFPTLITSSDPCSFGGSGWMMELVAVGDRYQGHSIFGEDGKEVDYAVISYSEVIRAGEKAYLPTSNIKGELDVTEGEFPEDAIGRMSWRQLR